ncbi:MAG: NBR1-Ig-like domain-containing protein [Anaerolineales bacterium]|nr:MAG: NBR1-Ig-like domain-containing protein [Anaerolineales bacterium]
MIRRNHRTFALLTIAVIMLACAPALAPASEPIPTFDPNSIHTVIAQTADAAATQTALVAPPTETSAPTVTPTELPTETPTPTFLFLLPTLTFTPTPVTIVPSKSEYACQIFSQDPQNDSRMARNESFDAKWTVVNVGTQAWERGNSDYLYNSGDRLHKTGGYDFDVTVSSGESVELVVNMQAPGSPGTYKTAWRIVIGKQRFCPLNLTIIVN